jgi:hypothetical protein
MIGWMDDRMVVYSEEGKGVVAVPWSGDGRWSLCLASRVECVLRISTETRRIYTKNENLSVGHVSVRSSIRD